MFNNVVFIDKELPNKEERNKKFVSFINFKENIFFLEFETVRNTGKLRVTLTSNFIVEGNNKIVKNIIKSEQSWEKTFILIVM